MRLGLCAKADEPQRVKIARYAHDYLKGRADVVVQDELSKHFPGAESAPIDRMDADVLVTVGGDGTILHAMQRNSAPVFGINVGEIGFLTEAEPIELPDALDRLLTKDFFIESRLRLETRVNREPLPAALNETVVKTARPSKMVAFTLAVEGKEVQRIRADGLIVATPTGSTSYAMSAGGPIVDPRVEALVVVPLAAFSLTSRPIVFPPTTRLSVHLRDPRDGLLVVDGQHERAITDSDEVAFTGAAERARFVRFRSSFYERLQERLGPG